jgi:transaldolase
MTSFTIEVPKEQPFKIFLDTGDIEDIRKRYPTAMINGVTTNPTLIMKSGRKAVDVYNDIASEFPYLESISAEVVADNYKDMIYQAVDLYTIAENITIKLPCTVEGLKACAYLSSVDNTGGKKITTNVTLVFSVAQAIMAAKAGATYISPFVGRCNDNSFSGVELVRAISNTYRIHGVDTKVLAASLRDVHHVSRCFAAGADVVTLPPKVFDKMYDHVLTREGLDIFNRDYNTALHQQRLALQQDL